MAAPTLDSGRQLLRQYSPSDLATFTSILGNRNNLKYLPHTEPWPSEMIKKWLESSIEHWLTEGYGWWILELKATAKAIGWCGLRRLKETNEVEILYLLDEEYWGRGLATEAAKRSVEYGFGTAGLREIIGLVVEGNIGSIRVLEKCGFVFQERAEYFNIECLKHNINNARFTEFYQEK